MKSRFWCFITIILAIAVAPVGKVMAYAEVLSVTQQEAVAWANAQIGKSLDYDNYDPHDGYDYWYQCVDFTAYYFQFLGKSDAIGGDAVSAGRL